VRLAEIDELRGNDARARERLQESVSLYPDHYEAWYRLAKVRRRLGDEEGAVEAEQTHQQVRQRVRPEAGFPE
jgi:cytochrome c-type biogenesis protein CcmH/NrfG